VQKDLNISFPLDFYRICRVKRGNMSYKKYIKKGGKLYGPYIYKSRREGNRVISEYVGKSELTKENIVASRVTPERKINVRWFLIPLALILIIITALIILKIPYPTSRVILESNPVYKINETITGDIKINMKPGELIPSNSIIAFKLNGQIKEMPLYELVSDTQTSGNYYAEGSDLTGSGNGYGFIGEKRAYPSVNFKLLVYQAGIPETPGENITENVTENITQENITKQNATETPTENITETPTENITETSPETPVTTETTSSTSASESAPAETPQQETPAPETTGITGSAVAESKLIEGQVNYGNEFRYKLNAGETASIVQDSVATANKNLSSDILNLTIENQEVIVTTSYYESEQGFGQDYLIDNAKTLLIDLGKIGFKAEEGNLEISIYSDNVSIAQTSRRIGVYEEAENVTAKELNETNVTLVSVSIIQIKDIPDINMAENSEYSLNLSDYFSSNETISYSALVPDNISIDISGDIAEMLPEENFTGTRASRIIAQTANETLESNLFNIIVSSGNLSLETKRFARLGKPVRWEKRIKLNAPDNLTLEIPASAENISVKKIVDGKKVELENKAEISTASLTGQATLNTNSGQESFISKSLNKAWKAVTGKAVVTVEEKSAEKVKEIKIKDNATEYTIEYYTQAPEAEENFLGKQNKEITIRSDENYQGIEAYTTITETAKERIKVLENGQEINASFIDNNNDSLIDEVDWIADTNKTYSINISKKNDITENPDGTFTAIIYPGKKIDDKIGIYSTYDKKLVVAYNKTFEFIPYIYVNSTKYNFSDFGQIHIYNLRSYYKFAFNILSDEKVDEVYLDFNNIEVSILNNSINFGNVTLDFSDLVDKGFEVGFDNKGVSITNISSNWIDPTAIEFNTTVEQGKVTSPDQTTWSKGAELGYGYRDASGGSYHRAYAEFSTYLIPDGALINSASFNYSVTTACTDTNQKIFDITSRPSLVSAKTIAEDTTNGTSVALSTAVGSYQTALGETMDTQLQNQLTSDWFAVGVSTAEDGGTKGILGTTPRLIVNYNYTFSCITLNITSPFNNTQTNITSIPINITINSTENFTTEVNITANDSTGKNYFYLQRFNISSSQIYSYNYTYNFSAMPPNTTDPNIVGYWTFDNNVSDISGKLGVSTVQQSGGVDRSNFNGKFGGFILGYGAEDGSSVQGLYRTNTTDNMLNMLTSGQFSVEFWVNMSKNHTSTAQKLVVLGQRGTGQKHSFIIQQQSNTQRIQFWVYNSAQQYTVINSTDLNLNRWYHVVATYNTGTANLYIEGVLNTTGAIIGAIEPNPTGNLTFLGEWDSDASETFALLNGRLDNIIIYNRTLTDAEVLNHYRLKNATYNFRVDVTNPYNSSSIEYVYTEGTQAPADNEYPQFGNYWDNNASLNGSGTALFNATINSTNGTVLLEINNTNYTATNMSGDAEVFNVSLSMVNNTYNYKWWSWGNGTSHNLNGSITRSYTVNTSDTSAPSISLINPLNNTATGKSNNSFYANFTDTTGLQNSTLYVYNVTGKLVYNETNISITGTENFTNISYSLPYDGVFYWNYRVCDNVTTSNCGFNATNFTLTYNEAPIITNISKNQSYAVASQIINFSSNIRDNYLVDSAWFSHNFDITNTENETQKNENTNYGFGNSYRRGQQFVFSQNVYAYTACVNLRYNTGNRENVTVAIYSTNAQGYPNTQLTNFTIVNSSITTTLTGFCRNFTKPAYLTANTMYALVLMSPSSSSNSTYNVRGQSNGNNYTNGMLITSINQGTTWTSTTAADLNFTVKGGSFNWKNETRIAINAITANASKTKLMSYASDYLPGQTFSYRWCANDSSGNENCSIAHGIRVYELPLPIITPTGNIISPPNNTRVNGNVTIDGNASNATAYASMQYKNATVAWTNITGCEELSSSQSYDCTWNAALFSNDSGGYDIRIVPCSATSCNTTTEVRHYVIDRTAPIYNFREIDYPESQSSVKDTQTLTLKINLTDGSGAGMNVTGILTDLTLLNTTGNSTMKLEAGNPNTGFWSFWNISSVLSGSSTGLQLVAYYTYDNATPDNNLRWDTYSVQIDNQAPDYDNTTLGHSPTAPIYANNNVTFQVLALDNFNLSGAYFANNFSGSWVNETINFTGTDAFAGNTSLMTTGNYSYYFVIYDDAGNSNTTERRTIGILGAEPTVLNVTLISPDNYANLTSKNVTFSYNYTGGSASTCNLFIDAISNSTTLNPVENDTLTFTLDFSSGLYDWLVRCNNTQNYYYESDVRNINITLVPDNEYPQFSNYWDNNASLNGSGTALFNATINSTNGTVLLEINNTNYTATNNSGDAEVFNVSLSMVNNTYNYKWWSWGNGTSHNLNGSITRSYTVNTSDITAPYFTTIPANATITYTQGFGVDYDAADDVAISYWAINWTTLFSINQSGYLQNSTENIAVGTYIINVSVNDTSGNMNSSLFKLTVNQASINVSLYLNDNQNQNISIAYGTASNATCKSTGGTATLSRFNISVSNPELTTLSANTSGYAYKCNSTGDANYSDNDTGLIFWLNITKATPSLTYYINSQTNNISIVYGSLANASAYADAGTIFIYRNSTLSIVKADVTAENGANVTLGADNYTYYFNVTGNQNYSDVADRILTLNITKATGLVYTYINNTRANFTATNNSATGFNNVWLNATLVTGEGNIELWVNNTLYNNDTSPQANITNLSFGLQNATSYYPSNQNYTTSSEVWWINITNVSDTTAPSVILEAPAHLLSTTSTSQNFQFSVTDDSAINSCSLILDNSNVSSSTLINKTETNTISYTLTVATHTWSINCTDAFGNTGNSNTRTITITSEGGGCPGCGGGACTNACSPKGELRCRNNIAEKCYDSNNDGCTEWASIENCSLKANYSCIQGACLLVNISCTPNWTCSWAVCDEQGYSYPSCTDSNNCNSLINYPEARKCICIPKWENCTEFSSCYADYKISDILQENIKILGKQSRLCNDTNKCYNYTEIEQYCNLSIPIEAKKVEWCSESYVEIYEKDTGKLVSRIKETATENISRVSIGLIVSNFTGYCDYCYDGKQDYDEDWIDCGGSCPECTELPAGIDIFRFIATALWILLTILLLFYAFLLLKYPKEKHLVKEIKKNQEKKEEKIKKNTKKVKGIKRIVNFLLKSLKIKTNQ